MAPQVLKPGDWCGLYINRAFSTYAAARDHADGNTFSSLDGNVHFTKTMVNSPALIVAFLGNIVGFIPAGGRLVWVEARYLGLPKQDCVR